MFLLEKFKALQNQLNITIEESKEKYYTYCPILKAFLNNKKIPCIPPLFQEHKFITDFKEKAELFHHFLKSMLPIY